MSKDKTAREMAFIREGIENLPKGLTGEELLRKEFPPIHWVIEGQITTGLTLLAGPPKMGKSWLILGMACALAVGGRVFGHIKVPQSEVLYLALEDTERRLKERLSIMGITGLGKIHFRTEWPMGARAIQSLNFWMLSHPDTRVVFVDTLQKISGMEDANSYGETYRVVGELKKIADKYKIAVVVIHHTNKAGAEDFVHAVLGSVGLTSAADTIITLTRPRGQRDGIIRVTGRDVEERRFGVRFDHTVGAWVEIQDVPETPSMKADGKMAAVGEREEDS